MTSPSKPATTTVPPVEGEQLRAALEFIAEGRDSGRHDGLPEDGPVHDAETMFAVAREALTRTEVGELHPRTKDLVTRFAGALAAKLRRAEIKYGYSDGWADPGWQRECIAHLAEHVQKGDPLDVAAYAAFCFHHGWSTATPRPAVEQDVVEQCREEIFRCLQMDKFKSWGGKEFAYHLGSYLSRAGLLASRDAVLEEVREIIEPWTNSQTMKLRAGELTAGEVRAVKAVLNSILSSLKSTSPKQGER